MAGGLYLRWAMPRLLVYRNGFMHLISALVVLFFRIFLGRRMV